MTDKIRTPYDGSSKPFTIGLRPIDMSEWIDIDHHHAAHFAEKRRLYAEETHNVLVSENGSEAAQEEVLELLVDHLNACHPGAGRGPASDEGGESITQKPLARAALLVQEDLVIMRKSPEGWRLIAASVCFPSAWNLREKFGKPLHTIHKPVPGFSEGTRNASMIERVFDSLRPEQPVLRWNWSLYGDSKLYHPASDNQMKNRFGEGRIDGKVILRLERQTLRKLPKSGDILFTIRIYLDPLEVLHSHAEGPQLAQSIADQLVAMSDAEIGYKGLSAERPRVLQRLAEISARNS